MEKQSDIRSAQPMNEQPERPPNYIVRAIVLLLILSPLCLLIGSSALVTTWNIVTGPPVISETPVWMRALMQMFRAVAATIGFFMPIVAVVKAIKVNSEFDAGNYGGAIKASKSAGALCRQSLILLVLMLMIMAVDLLSYFGSAKDRHR